MAKIQDLQTEIGCFPIVWQKELENAIFKGAYSQYNKGYTITGNKPVKKYTKLK